jgi:DNA-binding response OmpR family regulator
MAVPSGRTSPQRPQAAANVLLIHGDEDQRGRLARACERTGLQVREASGGAEGLRAMFATQPSAVILGVGFSDLDPMHVLERVRDLCDTPVLMLRGPCPEAEAVGALRAGADFVMSPPFGLPEVVARVEVLVRRSAEGDTKPPQRYADALVEIDVPAAEVRMNGAVVQVTPLEFRLLWEFVTHARQTLTHEHLLDAVWDGDALRRDRVKIYVGYLRDKFRSRGIEPPIVTARGFGYRYDPPR